MGGFVTIGLESQVEEFSGILTKRLFVQLN